MISRSKVCQLLIFIVFVLETNCPAQERSKEVQQVLQTYTEALGGKDAFEKLLSLKAVGVLKIRNLKKGTQSVSNIEMVVSGNRWTKLYASTGLRTGFDGKKYWNNSDDERLKKFYNLFDYWDPLTTPKKFWDYRASLFYAGEEKEDGLVTNHLTVFDQTENEALGSFEQIPNEFVFDKKNGLLRQIDFDSKIVDFLEYKKIGGIMVCTRHRTTYRHLDLVYEVETTSIKFNPMLADKYFERPMSDK